MFSCEVASARVKTLVSKHLGQTVSDTSVVLNASLPEVLEALELCCARFAMNDTLAYTGPYPAPWNVAVSDSSDSALTIKAIRGYEIDLDRQGGTFFFSYKHYHNEVHNILDVDVRKLPSDGTLLRATQGRYSSLLDLKSGEYEGRETTPMGFTTVTYTTYEGSDATNGFEEVHGRALRWRMESFLEQLTSALPKKNKAR